MWVAISESVLSQFEQSECSSPATSTLLFLGTDPTLTLRCGHHIYKALFCTAWTLSRLHPRFPTFEIQPRRLQLRLNSWPSALDPGLTGKLQPYLAAYMSPL